MQGKRIGELGNGDVGQQTLGGDAFGDQVYRRRRDPDRRAIAFNALAAFTRILGADMTQDLNLGRNVIELLAGVFTDAAQFSAARAPLLIVRQVVKNIYAGQIRGQRFATALFAVCAGTTMSSSFETGSTGAFDSNNGN